MMTTGLDLDQYRAARADRVGQGTAIEQSRAAAEVYSSVLAAREMPRSEALAIAKVKESCGRNEIASRAFFSYKRGTSTVSGPTIVLAKELARCWGNLHYGIAELRRDDEYRQSEMQAFAWDLETNQRVSTVFIVPHARWADGAAKPLDDFRDVYENNTNNGARRLREMILSVLPTWFVEGGKDVAMRRVVEGDGRPFPVRLEEALSVWSKIGVSGTQLADQRGRDIKEWTPHDLAQLEILYTSIVRGEIVASEVFGPQGATLEDIKAQGTAAGAVRRRARYEPQPDQGMPGRAADDDAAAGDGWPPVKQPGDGS